MATTISTVRARQILDSRGNPTVEAEVGLSGGAVGWDAVPSGASTGTLEAVELRDGGAGYAGKGVTRAVSHVNDILGPAVIGHDATEQPLIDQIMIDLDATSNASSDGLFGEGGNDTLRGGGSDQPDLLHGGPGNDHFLVLNHGTVNGGPGDDLFEFYGRSFDGAEIEDFTKGDDTIVLAFTAGAITTSDLDNMLRNSSGTALDLSLLGPEFENFGELTLHVPVSTLDASDFIIP